jgi:tagatose 1,6-diphosphate aldolase
VGLLCALEEQGYLSDPHRRRTPLIAGWSVAKTKRLGANGVKLLLFYHPRAGESTQAQELLVQAVAADCRCADVPFFLEPILYSPDPALKKGSPEFAVQRPRLAVEMVQRLGRLGPEVLKIEYPVDPAHQPNPAAWAEACAAVNAASPVPWTILSGGGSFEQFIQQLEVACRAGCAGFVGGRSIWQEAAALTGPAQTQFLQQTALPRVEALRQIAVAHAAPWFNRHNSAPVDEQWYHTY